MSDSVWIEELERVGALLRGHFQLTTGRHSATFFLLARLTERPWVLARWAQELARQVTAVGPVSTVVGPAMGGVIPAYAVAQEMRGVRALFAEKEDGGMVFRRGFALEPGEPVAVVEDVVTTGSSVGQVMQAVEASGAVVRVVAALVNRTGGDSLGTVPLLSVVHLQAPSWPADACPLCAGDLPLVRPKAARRETAGPR